ncbi:MAG: CapA family protein [Clostridiaceae bacterium]|nr:CapA family protein [Clostridiaceae bacterium]
MNNIKISFIGDLMCDQALLEAAKQGSSYNFSEVFSGLTELFQDSDIVVGNFETVLGGSEPYRGRGFIYNTPDSFASAIRSAGVDILTTANNHALDGGIEGLLRTKEVLQKLGFEIIGTNLPTETKNEKILIKEVSGLRLAFLSYTEPVNNLTQEDDPKQEIPDYLNLLCPLPTRSENKQNIRNRYKGVSGTLRYYLGGIMQLPFLKFIQNYRIRRKGRKGLPVLQPRTDNLTPRHQDTQYLTRLQKDLISAKSKADLVFACCHCGGQINEKPGSYVNFISDFFYNHGADAFIGNHPHVIQAVDKINDYIAAYCLGSISQTPDGEYRNNPLLPYYSMILHLEIDKLSKKIIHCSYTPVRAVADQKRYIRIYPLTKLINERPELQDELLMDARFLHTRITNTETNEDFAIRDEYLIY